jgi:hypothetical protein
MTARIQKTDATGNPLPGVIFPTIMVLVRKSVYDELMAREPRKVAEYLERKIAAAENYTFKVGRTVTREGADGKMYGDFNWSLSGTLYPQLAVWNPRRSRWELAVRPLETETQNS